MEGKKEEGRPTKYDPEFCRKVDEYLSSNQDEEVKVVKQVNEEKGYEIYDTKFKVKLPTIEGFALFLNVSKKSLLNWEKEYPEFLHALDKIRAEQHNRLVNSGLSGEYNPTIAKLILSSNHNYKERSEQENTGEVLIKGAKELASKLDQVLDENLSNESETEEDNKGDSK